MPTPGLFAGVDRSTFPSTPGFVRELARQSDVAWVAGYLQPAPNVGQRWVATSGGRVSTRGWMERLPDVRAEGLAVLMVYVGEQSPTVQQTRLSAQPSRRKGFADAQEAADGADRAQLGRGAAIYLDIEMVADPAVIEQQMLDYASAFFAGVTARGYGPGLYIPFQMARAVAALWPGLPVWVVNGTRGFPSPVTGDTAATPTARDPLGRELVRVRVHRPAIALSRTHSRPSSSSPDQAENRLDFPVHWQYALDRAVTIPVLPRGGDLGWDFNTSLVRDPSFPSAEPRLVVAPGREQVLALGSLPPARDAAGARTDGDGRHGDLWAPQATPPTPATVPAASGQGERLHPWSRPSVASPAGQVATVAVVTTDQRPGELTWTLTQAPRWTRARPLAGANAPAVRPLSGVRLLRFGAELLWFGIGAEGADDGRLLTTHRTAQGSWEPVAGVGPADFRTLPTSGLACGQRNDDVVDVFVLDSQARLHTMWRSRADAAFPEQNGRTIGGTEVALHPQTSITVVETRRTVEVFVLGMDGRLYTTMWTDRRDWSDLAAVGPPTFRPLTPSSVAVITRGDPARSTDVFVVDGSGRLATAWRPADGAWVPANSRHVGGTGTFPHPLTDIAAVSVTEDRISVTVVAHDGTPVRTVWAPAAPGAQPDWTDFAPVALPRFVAP